MANIPPLPRACDHWFLREWRNEYQLSITELAARVGLSHPQLSKMERGLHPFTNDHAQRLADALGINWTTLLHIDPRDRAGSMRRLLQGNAINARAFGDFMADEAAGYSAPLTEEAVEMALGDIPPAPSPRHRGAR